MSEHESGGMAKRLLEAEWIIKNIRDNIESRPDSFFKYVVKTRTEEYLKKYGLLRGESDE